MFLIDFATCLLVRIRLRSTITFVFALDEYVDGMEFLSLTREDLFRIVSATGIVKKILRHLDELKPHSGLPQVLFSQ